jgi:hypothetical protein
MKRLFALAAAFLLIAALQAQSPQKMSYQAVIRDITNHLVTTQIGMQISIIQGSSTGTTVYTETQTPTPNAYGLVSIEINGLLSTVTFGTFSAIDWSAGPYYIKTEIATAVPLTTYTINSTSQILSVPYALHAKTVASYPETDPVYAAWNKSTGISITSSQVSDFQSSVTNNTSVLANTAKNSYPPADAAKLANIDGSETRVTAGINVTVTGSGTIGSPYVVNAAGGSKFTHYIGELYGGGIVVSVWKEAGGVEHGLIASLTDIATANWSDVLVEILAYAAKSPIDGQPNCAAIITQSPLFEGAAKLCVDYRGGSFSDWYLPAIWELKECYNTEYIVNYILGANGFQLANYWSSTENDATQAWYIGFNAGILSSNGSKSSNGLVRAVRKF